MTLDAQSRLLGPRSRRSIAASGISTRSASTTTATPIRYHEAFKNGLFDLRTENDPGRWQTGLRLSRRCATAAWSRRAFPTGLPKPSFYFVFNTRRADLRRHPRARGDRAAVRLRMDQPQSLLRPLPAHRELFRGLRAVRARPAGRCARARAARAVSRRGARRRARRHLVAAGQRRLRPRPRRSCGARSRCSRRPATSCAAPSWSSGAAASRSPSRSWSTTRDEERLALAVRQPAQARRHHARRCAWSMRCSTRRAGSPSIST